MIFPTTPSAPAPTPWPGSKVGGVGIATPSPLPPAAVVSVSEMEDLKKKAAFADELEWKIRRVREDYYQAMTFMEAAIDALVRLDVRNVIVNLNAMRDEYVKHKAWLREIGQ